MRPASPARRSSFRRIPTSPALRASRSSRLKITTRRLYSSAAYTWRFGNARTWFTTLQANYGSGFPVAFESANANLSGRLPAHTTFDLAAGRNITPGRAGEGTGLGVQLIVSNMLNHQYPIKVANGFNTTQISNGRPFCCSYRPRSPTSGDPVNVSAGCSMSGALACAGGAEAVERHRVFFHAKHRRR